MTQPGMLWRHVVINTHGTWLHGDERGFRSRGHRIHSSGDYRNPPPKGEHTGLLRYHRKRRRKEVIIPREFRRAIGQAIVDYLLSEGYRVLCVAVGKVHAHGVVELPIPSRVKRIIGEAKRHASRCVSRPIPGALWSAGGEFVAVEDADHLKAAYEYDLYKQGPGAWTWSWRDRSREGCSRESAPRIGARRRPGPRSPDPGRRRACPGVEGDRHRTRARDSAGAQIRFLARPLSQAKKAPSPRRGKRSAAPDQPDPFPSKRNGNNGTCPPVPIGVCVPICVCEQ